jgi:hypothetical protein
MADKADARSVPSPWLSVYLISNTCHPLAPTRQHRRHASLRHVPDGHSRGDGLHNRATIAKVDKRAAKG